MLTKKEFKKRFIACCEEEFLDHGVEGIEIIQRKVNKAQHGTLNGLLFKPRDSLCAPTLYIEQFYPSYLEGRSIASLSRDAVDVVINSMDMASILGRRSCSLTTLPENLKVRMLSVSRNREFLENTAHVDLGCGFALIADISSDEFRAVVTSDLVSGFGLTETALIERALLNSAEKDPPVLWRLTDAACCNTDSCVNLLAADDGTGPSAADAEPGNASEPAKSSKPEARYGASEDPRCTESQDDDGPAMYVLTNKKTFWGAAALFYPGVRERIHELLGDDFYILPSSVHELIILPADYGNPEMLGAMIRDANETIIDCSDILSDDLYICRSGEVSKYNKKAAATV